MRNSKADSQRVHRTALLILAVAVTFRSFSVYKELEVGGTARSEVSAVVVKNHERHETHEKIADAESASAASLSCVSSVSWLPTSASSPTKTTLTPIEQIQVGDRVLAESPTGEEDTAFGSEIIPSDWRKLTLRAPKRDGTVAEVVLLRPLTWLYEQHGEVGGTVFISVPECGIDGNAEVLTIDPCPEIPSGAGRVVTGTFLHQARSTITLTIVGQSEPIECTGNHPFWSEDRQIFVRADSLQPNETLRTATGLTTVESWTPDLNPTPVYNIEVHGAHVYHVGTSGVVVHNPGGLNILGGSCWAGAQQASEIISETRKAAQRLGFDLDRVYTEGDRAFAFIDLTKKIRHGDIEKVKDFLRGQGIKTLQIESGEFMNKVFEKQLLDRLNSGKTFLGGVVEHSDYYGSVFRIVIEI
jgi:hypothetical protein